MSTPPAPHKQGLDLSDREAAALEAYAQAHGLTQQQAATQLAQQTLATRYRVKPKQGQVVPFRKKP